MDIATRKKVLSAIDRFFSRRAMKPYKKEFVIDYKGSEILIEGKHIYHVVLMQLMSLASMHDFQIYMDGMRYKIRATLV